MTTVFIYALLLVIMSILIIQSTMLYKLYRRENPKLNTDSKEWIDFTNLFKDRKIHNGYVISYYNEVEQFSLRFSAIGFTSGCALKKFLLGQVWFHCEGLYKSNYSDYDYEDYDDDENDIGEEENKIGEVACYRFDTSDIVDVTPIEEYYGKYGDGDNEYYVTCTFKNGTKVQIVFEYEENGDDK